MDGINGFGALARVGDTNMLFVIVGLVIVALLIVLVALIFMIRKRR